MKYVFAAAVLALSFSVEGSGRAQQIPQPLPTNTTNTGGAHHVISHHTVLPLRFPAPAARYELFIGSMLDTLRKASSNPRIPAGMMNKAILELRDCASRVEANGFVTSAENVMCRNIVKGAFREMRNQASASSSVQMLHP